MSESPLEDMDVSDSSEPSTSDDEIAPESKSLRLPGAMPLVPRTDHIDEATRKKIRKGQYVNLRPLIGWRRKGRNVSGQAVYNPLGQAPYIPGEMEEGNLPISQWVDAFIVFMSVHIRFHPNHIQGMLRHMQIVKKMCTQGKNGVEYDTQFRRLRAQHLEIQWGEYLPELAADVEGDAQQLCRPRKNFGYYKTHQGLHRLPAQRSARVCYRFNLPESCKTDNCKYINHKNSYPTDLFTDDY